MKTKNPVYQVKTMLDEDRADSISYIKDQLSLNGLRSATQNLQAICNIIAQIISRKNTNIVDAYKIANMLSTGYHYNINIFHEIKRDSIESHKGNIIVPNYVNLDMAYVSEKLKETKAEYLTTAVANMLDILNLTAHILSRKNLSKKAIILTKYILDTAVYKPCKDIVAATNINQIWKYIVYTAKECITGTVNPIITVGESRTYRGHKIVFTPNDIVVDNEYPISKENTIVNNQKCCTLFFENIDAWLYFYESGKFGIQIPEQDVFDIEGKICSKAVAQTLYRELVA
jgi:hypothetical protein